MRKKKYTRIFTILPLLLLPVLLSGCSSALMDPQGPVAEAQKTLIITAFWLMMIVVIPVIVMTIVFGWRYRNTNLEAKYTPDWAHSNKIEVVVWLIPCVIILILAIITWRTSHSLAPQKPLGTKAETLEIQVVSLDWKWLFIYPELGIATVNEMAMPVDVPVHFNVTSASVMNSFMIPTLGSQIYAMAGMDNDVNLIASEVGVYDGRSTNYSGRGFSEMLFDARALPQEGFEAWVDKVKQAPKSLTFNGTYPKLAEPSTNLPVLYFSDVSPELYRNIIESFNNGRAGEGGNNGRVGEAETKGSEGEASLSAEAAE